MLFHRIDIDESGSFLCIWKITESLSELLDLYSAKFTQRPEIFKSEQRNKEWLTTRLLLKEMTSDNLNIMHRDNGKPYLENSELNISISHSKDYVAILLSSKEVGVDIEKYSERVIKISTRFVSELEHIDKDQEIQHLLLHWSAKETLFKIMNRQNVDFKHDLFLKPFSPKEKGVIQAFVKNNEVRYCYDVHYCLGEDFVLTWCIK